MKIAKYWWATWLAINFVLHSAHGWSVGDTLYAQDRISNFLYQLDTLASITIGAAWLAFPKWLLHRQVFFIYNAVESQQIL